ncbi:MAG TPA: PHP domain-containing protein [Thermomicrobiales bacterium]|nr:PHP domain-containing protein [Thermomicrobiales bacterium]
MPAHPVDLHTHSQYSDGSDTPAALVANAAAVGVRVLGLTDHDTIAGLAETAAAAAAAGIDFLPGVEISTSLPLAPAAPDRRLPIHLLGYAFEPTHQALRDALAAHALARSIRVGQMIERVNQTIAANGGPAEAVNPQRVIDLAGRGSIGRPHLAQALVETGRAANVGDAFERWLGRGKPGYVRRAPVDTLATIALIRRAGGAPVLAHPLEYGDLDALLPRLVAAGLLGIETDYGDYDAASRAALHRLADRFGLVASGGSDYHGLAIKPDRTLGMAPVPLDAAERLRAASRDEGERREAKKRRHAEPVEASRALGQRTTRSLDSARDDDRTSPLASSGGEGTP